MVTKNEMKKIYNCENMISSHPIVSIIESIPTDEDGNLIMFSSFIAGCEKEYYSVETARDEINKGIKQLINDLNMVITQSL